MDTKSKNKRFAVPVLILMLVSLSLALLTMADLYHKREYLRVDNYFQSAEFQGELQAFAELVKAVHVDYADYTPGKLDEETANELKKEHEKNLQTIKENNQLQDWIEAATNEGDAKEVARLTEEHSRSLQKEIAQETSRYQDQIEEKIAQRDGNYKQKKNSLLLRSGSFVYYVEDKKNDKFYSNLGYKPSEALLEDHARYVEKLPNNNGEFYVNRTYQLSELSGIFYVPHVPDGYSQIHADALYYDSIRERLLNEFILLAVSLVIFGLCYWYLPVGRAVEVPLVAKIMALFRMIPLDIRMVLLFALGLTYLAMVANIRFFFFPINSEHFFIFGSIALLTAYLLLQLMEAWLMYNQPERFSEQWQKSIWARQRVLLQESYANRGMFFKAALLFTLTIFMGMSIGIVFHTLIEGGEEFIVFLCFLYGLFYMIVVLPHLLRRLGLMNRIMQGASEMANGNMNVTIQKVKKGKLSDLAHSLNNITKGLKNAVEEQMKSERMKSELITNVSHDLKTPLTSIINYVTLLKQENLTPEERKNYIDVLDRKSDRLRVLIDDLFDAAKMSSGAVELNIEQVNVASLLNQSIAEFNDKIEQSTLTFRVTTEQPKIVAPLDGKKTWRVFENLIGNALKYSMPNTRVLIHLAETQDEVILTFKNVSAYEIDFDAQELFERFKRADQSRNTEGSGLGLAIAKSIVELQGGRLLIDIDGDYFKVTVIFRKSL